MDIGQANVFQNFPGSAGSYHLLVFFCYKKKKLLFSVFKTKANLRLLKNHRSLCFRVPELL